MNKSWATERNEQVYLDHMSGMKYSELSAKYGVTRERIRQIIMKQVRKIEYEAMLEERKKNALEGDVSFYDLVKTLDIFKACSGQVIRGLNAFFRNQNGHLAYNESIEKVLPIFMNTTELQFLQFRNVGVTTAEIMAKVQTELAKIAEEKGWKY